MTDDRWFERVWEHREEVLYPSLFGKSDGHIYPVAPEVLAAGKLEDPRWRHCGVLKYGPTASRASWLYVSSGLSNAWHDDRPNSNGQSGFGCEFVIEATIDELWPILRLHEMMVSEIGACCGVYPTWKPVDYFVRFPMGKPIDDKASKLNCMMVAPPMGYPGAMQLESGLAHFYALAGITVAEKEFAKTSGGEKLLER